MTKNYPKFAKNCPKFAKNCPKIAKTAKNCQKLPKIAQNSSKLIKIPKIERLPQQLYFPHCVLPGELCEKGVQGQQKSMTKNGQKTGHSDGGEIPPSKETFINYVDVGGGNSKKNVSSTRDRFL